MAKTKKAPSGPKIVPAAHVDTNPHQQGYIHLQWDSFYALVDSDLIYQYAENLFEFRANNVIHRAIISPQTIYTKYLPQFTLDEIDEIISQGWVWDTHISNLASKNNRNRSEAEVMELAREVLSGKHGTLDEIRSLLQDGFKSLSDVRVAEKNGLDSREFYALLPFIGKGSGKLSWDAALKLKNKYDSCDMNECMKAKKGGFPSLDDMRQANNIGFEKYNIWQDAITRGCSNRDEYDLLTEHGWPALNIYHQARNQGFDESEAELYDWTQRHNLGTFDNTGVQWLREHDWAHDIIESHSSNGIQNPWSAWLYRFIVTCGHPRFNLLWLSKQLNSENVLSTWRGASTGTQHMSPDDLVPVLTKPPYDTIGVYTPHTMEYSLSAVDTAVLDPNQTKKTGGMPTLPPPPDVDSID